MRRRLFISLQISFIRFFLDEEKVRPRSTTTVLLPSNRIYDLIKIRELVVASCIDEAVNFNSSFSK